MARNRRHQRAHRVTTDRYEAVGKFANPDAAKAAHERARSSAAGFHASGSRRQRTRSGAKKAAIRAASW